MLGAALSSPEVGSRQAGVRKGARPIGLAGVGLRPSEGDGGRVVVRPRLERATTRTEELVVQGIVPCATGGERVTETTLRPAEEGNAVRQA